MTNFLVVCSVQLFQSPKSSAACSLDLLPKDQVYKIVQVMDQEVGLRWSLNDEGGLNYCHMQKIYSIIS
jgi:hypothetical protein